MEATCLTMFHHPTVKVLVKYFLTLEVQKRERERESNTESFTMGFYAVKSEI